MCGDLSRRDFLKLAGLSACSMVFKSPPPEDARRPLGLGRVTVAWSSMYAEPSFRARRLTTLKRDTIITLLAREIPDEGPSYNPLW